MHALAHARLVQQIHGHLLQHPGADAAQHIVRALALDQHRINARAVQQLAQQQTGRACAHDSDLGADSARSRH